MTTLRPVISEKSFDGGKTGHYTFRVPNGAAKREIAFIPEILALASFFSRMSFAISSEVIFLLRFISSDPLRALRRRSSSASRPSISAGLPRLSQAFFTLSTFSLMNFRSSIVLNKMVSRLRLELSTHGLKGRCSTG